MAKEIERKFLVEGDSYRNEAVLCHHIEQGYLCRDVDSTVRVRILDDKAFITVKGRNHGITRDEWEYEIPISDAQSMISRCCKGNIIVKNRYIIYFGGFKWEIDEIINPVGIPVIAEVELDDEKVLLPLPHFIGAEVTGNPKFYNSNF